MIEWRSNGRTLFTNGETQICGEGNPSSCSVNKLRYRLNEADVYRISVGLRMLLCRRLEKLPQWL